MNSKFAMGSLRRPSLWRRISQEQDKKPERTGQMIDGLPWMDCPWRTAHSSFCMNCLIKFIHVYNSLSDTCWLQRRSPFVWEQQCVSHLPPCFLSALFKPGIGTIYFDGIDVVCSPALVIWMSYGDECFQSLLTCLRTICYSTWGIVKKWTWLEIHGPEREIQSQTLRRNFSDGWRTILRVNHWIMGL